MSRRTRKIITGDLLDEIAQEFMDSVESDDDVEHDTGDFSSDDELDDPSFYPNATDREDSDSILDEINAMIDAIRKTEHI